MDRIILKKGREASLLRFHPWVFSGAVASISGNPSEGDLVEVFSSGGEFLATGHYQKGSITVRVLSFEPGKIGDSFWEDSIRQALQAREAAGLFGSGSTDCFRLVHGEGDNLPGLIVDYYNGACVMQAHSVGMFRSSWNIFGGLTISSDFKFVGKQYWDNTGSEDRCLPAYTVANASITDFFTFPLGRLPEGRLTIGLYFGNLFNRMYEADAWVYRAHFRGGSTEWYQKEGLFPQAPFNCMFRVGLQF